MRIVNVLVGAIVGLAFWYYVTPLYGQAARSLAAVAVPALFGHGYQLGGTGDALLYTPDGLIAARVFMRWVETNVITLIALFAFVRRPLTASNLGRCAIGSAAPDSDSRRGDSGDREIVRDPAGQPLAERRSGLHDLRLPRDFLRTLVAAAHAGERGRISAGVAAAASFCHEVTGLFRRGPGFLRTASPRVNVRRYG